jgi:hypothetical protein
LRDRLNIGVRGSKLLAKLSWRKPLVVVGRSFALLVVEQLEQCRLLFRTTLEKKQHSMQSLGVANGAPVEFGTCKRMYVPCERNQFALVGGSDNSSGRYCGLAGAISSRKKQAKAEQWNALGGRPHRRQRGSLVWAQRITTSRKASFGYICPQKYSAMRYLTTNVTN